VNVILIFSEKKDRLSKYCLQLKLMNTGNALSVFLKRQVVILQRLQMETDVSQRLATGLTPLP